MNFPPRFRLALACGTFLLASFALPNVFAATHRVDSLAALQAAIDEAVAGDIITLKDGVYSTARPISVKCTGSAEQPITIEAENVGEVEIGGTHGFTVSEPAAHVIISGFKFTHAAGKCTIGADTAHVQLTRNTFRCPGDGPLLSVIGDDVQVDHNDFGDKNTAGSLIAVSGTGSQVARRIWIHHNYFHDFANAGANVAEMLRFGLSTLSTSTGNGIVERNLFVRCRGETELVSNRCSGNTYRYNTLVDSPTAQFSLRHGNDCEVYGNYFRATQGLRFFGDRHRIYSNYFEANYIAINVGNGSVDVAEGGSATGHDRPDYCVVAFNTLVDNRTHYQMSKRAAPALGATHTTFANNILLGGGVAAKIDGPNTDAIWAGNIVWTKSGPGDLPESGFTKVDPLLAPDDADIKRPQPESPALGSAVGDFPFVTVDQDGQPRPEMKSKGADEPGAEPPALRILSPEDVGPHAK